jgi:hypothetical protein
LGLGNLYEKGLSIHLVDFGLEVPTLPFVQLVQHAGILGFVD